MSKNDFQSRFSQLSVNENGFEFICGGVFHVVGQNGLLIICLF